MAWFAPCTVYRQAVACASRARRACSDQRARGCFRPPRGPAHRLHIRDCAAGPSTSAGKCIGLRAPIAPWEEGGDGALQHGLGSLSTPRQCTPRADLWRRTLGRATCCRRRSSALRGPVGSRSLPTCPCPAVGTLPMAGHAAHRWAAEGRGLGDPCRVYRVVCQALPLPERARPALACGLHYYERRSNMRPAARGAPFLYVGRT